MGEPTLRSVEDRIGDYEYDDELKYVSDDAVLKKVKTQPFLVSHLACLLTYLFMSLFMNLRMLLHGVQNRRLEVLGCIVLQGWVAVAVVLKILEARDMLLVLEHFISLRLGFIFMAEK